MAALSDMGGRTEFFGPIVREPSEPVFHVRWEGRVFGIAAFVLALFRGNIEAFRFAQEQLPREGTCRAITGACSEAARASS